MNDDIKCPLINNIFPDTPCPKAINAIRAFHNSYNRFIYAARIKKIVDIDALQPTNEECEWYIIHKKSCFCFWKWMSRRKHQRPHSLEEVARLTGISIVNAWLIQKQALENLRSTDEVSVLSEFTETPVNLPEFRKAHQKKQIPQHLRTFFDLANTYTLRSLVDVVPEATY